MHSLHEGAYHLFYTDHIESMFRQHTPINELPHGFGARPEQIVLSAGGHSAAGPWRLHEASHIYRVRETGQYLALIEGVRPHPTRPNYDRLPWELAVMTNHEAPESAQDAV